MGDKRPGREDADAQGCVIAWHVVNGMMVAGIVNVNRNPFYTHWMPAIHPPDGADEARGRFFKD